MNNDKNFNDFISFLENTNNVNKVKKKKTNKIVLYIINIISITLLISGGVGLKILYDKKEEYESTRKMEKELSNIYVREEQNIEENLPSPEENTDNEIANRSFSELLSINNDTVGWLKVNNTNINMPIVKASNNNYYLTHNFKKEYSSIGWLFADYRNEFTPTLSKNTIIYGHTFRNNSDLMMSTLKKVLTNEWLENKDNYKIIFDTVNNNMNWQIFSIYTTPVTDDYLKVNFNNDDDFLNFANNLKNKSIRNFDVNIEKDDNIITLSTCYNNTENRLVVHAKLIK